MLIALVCCVAKADDVVDDDAEWTRCKVAKADAAGEPALPAGSVAAALYPAGRAVFAVSVVVDRALNGGVAGKQVAVIADHRRRSRRRCCRRRIAAYQARRLIGPGRRGAVGFLPIPAASTQQLTPPVVVVAGLER